MLVKLKLVKGQTEIFETENYVVTAEKDLHPAILSGKIYSNGKLVYRFSRKHPFYYEHFVFDESVLKKEESELAHAMR